MATSSAFDPARLFSLEGRTALVTGGSRGIGAMIAEGFLAAGARVLLAARDEAALAETVDRLSPLGPCEALLADLATRGGCHDLAAAVGQRTERLDVLVNNAGATFLGSWERHPADEWDLVLQTNLTAVHEVTTSLLPLLRAAATAEDPARVITIGSTSGLAPSGLPDIAYGASKAAVHLLARQHAALLAPQHILVNVLAPGLFPTRMSAFLDHDALRDPVLSTIPLKRAGRPEEIAGAALFLATRAGGYTTGEVLVVDGGRTGIGRADPIAGL